ncbi:hypothetical protein B0A50_00999 [Salinomyces thailandicus]|uniref:DUF7514 domain-containing protein n=1 Tax=Salinomyces thailandicus TaxID=706561 RepID=A0A4U0UBZ9_9PEZI|nr:hypothetical protein B0A50_00999 [Salinomyces thailandica]
MEGPRSQPSSPLPLDPQMPKQAGAQIRKPHVAQSPSLPPQQGRFPSPPQLSSPLDAARSNTSRSRTSSFRAASGAPFRAVSGTQQPQPIKDAVSDAFDQSPVAQSSLDPELVRQVTEQVIRNLQSANLNTAAASGQLGQRSHFPPSSSRASASARSPTQSSTDSIPQRQYTPPSPEKRWIFGEKNREESGYGSSSPDPVHSDPDSIDSKRSDQSTSSQRETPRPGPDGLGARTTTSNATASRRRRHPDFDAVDGAADDRRKRRGNGSDGTTRQRYRRDSKSSESDYYDATSSRNRPRPPKVPLDVREDQEATTLEKIWQPLFDGGNPTVRLSQFLRGLALHLIDDHEPKGSLVVTPAKMARFFSETRTNDEAYPWETIFSPKMSSASLGKMYQKLLCQHHLVQTQFHENPTIPGLTPSGFEQLMTCLIQAHPENEFERLAKAVMNMPISNADNKSERFPKELSRRLLPGEGNLMAEQRIVASLNHEPVLVQLRGAASMPPPPPPSNAPSSQPPSQPPSQQSSFTERERKPYSSTPFSNAVDDDDLGPSISVPLERERKPYTAREGVGKKYGHDSNEPPLRERDSRPPPTSYRGEMPIPQRRNSRSNPQIPTQAAYSNASSDPVNIPPPKSHRHSVNQGPPPSMYNSGLPGMGLNGSVPKASGRRTPPPSMNGSMPKTGRRTPPPRNVFARSEPMGVDGVPPSQFASNLHGQGFGIDPRYNQPSGDADEDFSGRTRHHNRRPTDRERSNTATGSSTADDDPAHLRSYPIPLRPPPSAQGGCDPSFSTPSQMGSSFPNRRSTWYGATNPGTSASSAAPP